MKPLKTLLFLLPCLFLAPPTGGCGEDFTFANTSSFETRHFPVSRGQHPINHSETLETTFTLDYKNGANFHVLLKPRAAIDFANPDRNRYIPNEAYLELYGGRHSFKAGLQLESWGGSPFYKPLDVLNRSDLEFDFYNPPRLGELMLSHAFDASPSNRFKLYALPLFQKTPLPELNTRFDLAGRAGFVPYTLDDQTQYLSSSHEIGVAAAWHADFEPVNLDVYFYHGPERIPGFVLRIDDQGALRLRPFYYVIDMVGASFEKALRDWVFRLDVAGKITKANDPVPHSVAYEDGQALPKSYVQFVPSLEKTWEGLLGGQTAFTLMAAYYGDSEGTSLRNFRPFQNDAFFGLRVNFNDARQNQAELGFVKDLGNAELALLMEWDMRLYRELKISVGGVLVQESNGLNTPLSFFDNNSQVYSKISYSF